MIWAGDHSCALLRKVKQSDLFHLFWLTESNFWHSRPFSLGDVYIAYILLLPSNCVRVPLSLYIAPKTAASARFWTNFCRKAPLRYRWDGAEKIEI